MDMSGRKAIIRLPTNTSSWEKKVSNMSLWKTITWKNLLELWSVELGPEVGVALEEEEEAGFHDEGGKDEERKSWGKREIAGEVEDNAELVDDDDPLRLDVGD